MAGVPAQPGYWLSLATWQKPDVYGVDPRRLLEYIVAPCTIID
jgi:hypothetical protein